MMQFVHRSALRLPGAGAVPLPPCYPSRSSRRWGRHRAAKELGDGGIAQAAGKLSKFFAASGAFDPFLGRCLPPLITAAGLAETGSEAIACYRRGGSGEAELLRRSLERMHPMVLSNGVVGQNELDTVAAATADPSFSFLDALSVAAWGRVPCSDTAR
jgi:hypothetical protein